MYVIPTCGYRKLCQILRVNAREGRGGPGGPSRPFTSVRKSAFVLRKRFFLLIATCENVTEKSAFSKTCADFRTLDECAGSEPGETRSAPRKARLCTEAVAACRETASSVPPEAEKTSPVCRAAGAGRRGLAQGPGFLGRSPRGVGTAAGFSRRASRELVQSLAFLGTGPRGKADARHSSYLATTRRMALPHGSQIAARKATVATPCVTSSGRLAAQEVITAGNVSGCT